MVKYSQTIVMECFFGDLIDPKGWLKYNGEVGLSTLHYVEYGNRGLGQIPKARLHGLDTKLSTILIMSKNSQ